MGMINELEKFKEYLEDNGLVTIDGYDSEGEYDEAISKLYYNRENEIDDLFLDHITCLDNMPNIVQQVRIYLKVCDLTATSPILKAIRKAINRIDLQSSQLLELINQLSTSDDEFDLPYDLEELEYKLEEVQGHITGYQQEMKYI